MQAEANNAHAHRASQVESMDLGVKSAGVTGGEKGNEATAAVAAAAQEADDVETLLIGGRMQATTAQCANPPELKPDSCARELTVTTAAMACAAAATSSNEGDSRRGGNTSRAPATRASSWAGVHSEHMLQRAAAEDMETLGGAFRSPQRSVMHPC